MFFFMLTDEKSSLKVCKHCGDAIISVGYRVNSIQATRFRIWATGILKEYMIKGFAMDDDRLKQGKQLLEKTISVNCWKEFAPSVPANAEYGMICLLLEG